ncbi:MAG: 23S rRNA (adenine(2503)-C(2))-methyltransferase RlmN [Clostridiales bacterium]|jgi:23S rRNA (adenine2503-C2)-methyltransferase|nr:23S rRNA (adenine(2503)-C(2))-methyltransferase RlmN [Clostridiales bacterium]
MNKPDLKSMPLQELELFTQALGEPKFRAKQIFQWLHQKNISDFDGMTTLSKPFREVLKEKTTISFAEKVEKIASSVDFTTKYLFQTENDYIIESVLMKYDYGNSVCVSSQAGCRMGCAFCASTIGGLERNLTAGEIAAQIYEIARDTDERVSHVVVMGCGEPLDNFDELLRFIQIINSPQGANIGQRHITVSTCGLADKMYRLADKELQITLAVSLHAPNDDIRARLMPVAKTYDMGTLLAACNYYADKTKRRLTFEYALIADVNDRREHARELAEKLRGMLCHVNLIPVNPVAEHGFQKSEKETVERFAGVLKNAGIETTVRRRLGNDINAACGQLRNQYRGIK